MDKRKLMNERIQSLLIGYLTDAISPEELETLKKWLKLNDRNKEIFGQIKASWYLSQDTNERPSLNTDLLWASIQDRIKSPRKSEGKEKNYK